MCGEGLAVGMALSAKLTMRQGQTMVLTPQLLQAIKLLQMPNLELTQFIENELASNPLLERAEEREDPNPEPQDGAGLGIDAVVAQPGDEKIEAAEIAEHAEERLHEKRSIQGRQRVFFERRMEDLVGKIFALLPLEERTNAGLARIGGHRVKCS